MKKVNKFKDVERILKNKTKYYTSISKVKGGKRK